MELDAMRVRLHLRRVRVVAVLVDVMKRLVVGIVDTRRVVRCPYCGYGTARVHDRRRLRVRDLPTRGRPTTLEWVCRRFACEECSERHWEDHPEIVVGRRTHVTRRLARQVVRDVNHLSIREISRRYGLRWHFIMALVGGWSDLVVAARRRRRCRASLVDETSLRRGHRAVTVLIDEETGQGLGVVRRRDAGAQAGFFAAQGHRWWRGVKVVVTDGSPSYRAAIDTHLGHATHVVDGSTSPAGSPPGSSRCAAEPNASARKEPVPPSTPTSSVPAISNSAASTASRQNASKRYAKSWLETPSWKWSGRCSNTSTASTSPAHPKKRTRRPSSQGSG